MSVRAPGSAPASRFRRLPPPARVGVYLLGCLLGSIAWCGVVWLLARPGGDVWVSPGRYPLASSLYLAGTYALWVGGALWTWRVLEGGTLRRLGLTGDPHWASRLALGLAWGLASLAALFALELAGGVLLWGDAAWRHTPWSATVTAAGTALFFGATEELLFRGFIYRTLRRDWSAGPAIAASSCFFALVHFTRFDLGWTHVVTPFAGLVIAGALLAWTVERTRSLWFATGLHAGWVYLFFLADRQHLFGYPAAQAWLTGGGFPLGGAAALAMLLGLAGLLRLPRALGPA